MVFKILVLDRTSVDMKRLKDMSVFEEYSFEIIGHTFDLTDIISPAAKIRFDLLLIVNRENGMIAADTLNILARKKLDIPAVVISFSESARDMRECFLLGALDYLVEPVGEEDIAAMLVRVSKTISERITDREYAKAIDTAFEKLTITDENKGILDKLNEFLMKVKGRASTVEEAADFFGFNPDYFRRVFKKKVGVSFSGFYKSLMMDYAKLLLLSGNYKVGEVSEILGFSSSDYFTRVFKKITGHLPSEYRK